MLRTQNSNANVSEASNDANIEAINTYKSLVAELRADKAAADERADKLQTELNTAIRELAAATAKVDVMTTQIMSLNEEIKLCRAEIRQLRGLPA